MSTNAPTGTAADLEAALRELLGDAVAPGDATHAVDGLLPGVVASPGGVEEVAGALAVANECGAAVVAWGGGRHMGLGNVPSRYDVALLTTKLGRVIEYEPADLTVTVEAGATIGTLQQLLAEHGQFLPIDAPSDATVGGVLSAGVSGPSRYAYGLPRDWLLGCRIAHADGNISKGGGRVVKNVAGYDMPKLAVGSLGTLGVIVEATFKVAPLPVAQETLLAILPSITEAASAVLAAAERGLALRAVAVAESEAAFWLAGPASAVERTARELHELTGEAEPRRLQGEESERWWTEPAAGADVAVRASLPPSAVVDFLERFARSARDVNADVTSRAYPPTGLVLARLRASDADRTVRVVEEARRAAVQAGGSLVVTSAPVEVKERVDVWGDPGSALPLMRRLKQQFDPNGTLNPGRFVGGL